MKAIRLFGKSWDLTPRRVVGAVSAVMATASFAFARCGFGKTFNDARAIKTYQAIVLCVWIVGPPIWFWVEYYFLYPRRNGIPENFERFKYGQDQAAKIWLAIITALLGLYFGKDFMH